MLPMENHPLTSLLLAAARATHHDAMRQFLLLARQMQKEMTPTQVEQCKLAADVLIERQI